MERPESVIIRLCMVRLLSTTAVLVETNAALANNAG